MRFALINPNWSFAGSIYFGCREPHLPLEYGYAKALLESEGHQVLLVDGQMDGLSLGQIRRQVEAFRPDFTVVTTAPSYLFWRCPPPELRVPQELVRALRGACGVTVVIGPHASTAPKAALSKLGADVAVMGECEEVLVSLAQTPRSQWPQLSSIAYRDGHDLCVQGAPHASDMRALPPLRWPDESVRYHYHHHHRFDAEPAGPGAEVEASRGCPYRCTFCAKENFRNSYRKRPLETVLEEIDGLIRQGVEYVYFVDEIFLPSQPLLEALVERGVRFGVQTRIDLWDYDMLELLGLAGCVSIEAGVESLTEEGRQYLQKNCRLSTEELTERLIFAKRRVPFVQANLIYSSGDDVQVVEDWRSRLQTHGVWANMPVPLFPYPGSPDYTRLWGPPDDRAWERALNYYLSSYGAFSDIQDARPLPLSQLELSPFDGA